jgi:hypothetical protein
MVSIPKLQLATAQEGGPTVLETPTARMRLYPMRYLRSWVFDIGLVLIIAAPAAAYFVSSRTYVVSQPGDLIRVSYIDYDLRLPIGLAASGLIVVAVAMRRIPRKFN